MDRIKELISKMTLEEKASLCSGADNWHTKEIKRLNIPSVMMVDGPFPSSLCNSLQLRC